MKSAFKFFSIFAITLSLTACWEAKQETSLSELAQGLMIRGQRRVLTGACQPFTVHAISGTGSLLPDSTVLDLLVQLGGAGSYIDESQAVHLNPTQSALYADPNCISGISAIKSDGINAAKIYIRSSRVENVLLVASDRANALRVTSASLQTFGPTRIRVTNPANVIAGVCSTAITAVPIDPGGDPFRIGWSDNFLPSDTSGGLFYLDSTCQQAMPSTGIAIPRSETPVTFYYRNAQGTPAANIRVSTVLSSLSAETKQMVVLRPALLSMVSPASLTATLGGSLDFDVTVSNGGQVEATSVSYSIDPPFTPVANGTTCTNRLAPAVSCVLKLRFTPLIAQTYTNTLTASYFSGAVTTTATRNISATGRLPAGSDDPLFNGNGIVTLNNTTNTRPFSTLSGTRLMVAQSNPATGNLYVARLNANGSLDNGFGTGGRILFPPNPALPVLRGLHAVNNPASSTILVGEIEGKLALYRISANGGVSGPALFTIDADPAQNLEDAEVIATTVSNDRLLVAMIAEGRFVLARFTEALAPDATFGMGGFITESFSTAPSQIGALRMVGNKITVGLNFAGGANMLVRYNSDGSPDNFFNNTTNRRSLTNGETIRAITSSGETTFIGSSSAANNFILRRMSNVGVIENTVSLDFGGIDTLNSLTMNLDNDVIPAGRTGNSSALARLDAGLNLDTAFGNNGRVVRAGNPSAETFQVHWNNDGIYQVGVANGALTIRRQTNATR